MRAPGRQNGSVQSWSSIGLDDGSSIALQNRRQYGLHNVRRAVHLADALMGDGSGNGLHNGAHLGQGGFMNDGGCSIAVQQRTCLQIARTGDDHSEQSRQHHLEEGMWD